MDILFFAFFRFLFYNLTKFIIFPLHFIYIVDKSYKHVKKILENNVNNIRNVAKLLIKKETITSEEFYNVMKII